MGLPKGKTNNKNGRPAGTANKITSNLRAKINAIVEKQIDSMESDLQGLKPLERLQIVEKLISYCVPKLQSMTVENQIELEYKQLEALLSSAPEQAIEAITAKILTLKIQNNETEN